MNHVLLVVPVLASLAALAFVAREVRRRHLHRWLGSYLTGWPRRGAPRPVADVHLLLCIADHWEPRQGRPRDAASDARVRRWAEDYPRLFVRFADSDGRPPRHTFFYPAEEYEPAYLDALAGLCRAGFGEVEVHLHHENDTAANLRQTLLEFKRALATRHGLLARHKHTGEVVYGFLHGNWALDNSHPEGRFCGVDDELDVLRETGCYADFTLPSAPNPAQAGPVNTIYYAVEDGRPASHARGVPVGRGKTPDRALMLIPGPLVLDWRNRKRGLLPAVENAVLQRSQPPGVARLPAWLGARVQVPGRPDWFFVKLHAHGATDADLDTLLGEPMTRFHEDLARLARENPKFHFHYVTAREMYNLARAAEAGWSGAVDSALDYEVVSHCEHSAKAAELTPG